MSIADVLTNAEQSIHWQDRSIDGLDIPADERTRIAAGCLDLALEHQKSICLLITNKMYGSAFALARLLFEAYIRGIWIRRCADDGELEKYKKGKLDKYKNFGELISDIENLEAFDVGVLSDIKAKSWNVMNSFTHCGMHQATRRNSDRYIQPNYPEEEIIKTIEFSTSVGLFTAMEIAYIANNEKLAISVLERARALNEQ